MRTQLSDPRKLLFAAVAAGAALLAVILLSGGGDGVSTLTWGSLPPEDAGNEGGSIAIGGIDGLLGTPVAQSTGKATMSSAALPPSTGAARDSAGAVKSEAAGGQAPSALASQVDDRKIVQTASMRLEVKEVGASFEEVGRVAAGAGGFVASSSFSNQGVSRVASMTVRVPATRYQEVLGELRRLGVKVVAEDSKSSDVTSEYSDLGARLRNLEATELQLLALLGRAATINEILQVQDRLNNVRGEIEQVKGRMALLDKLTDLATITVHLQPVAIAIGDSDGSRLGNEVRAAWDDSIEFLTDIAAGALHVIVFAWWIPLFGVPALLAGNRLLRGRPRALEVVD